MGNNHYFKKSLGQNFLKYSSYASDLTKSIDFSTNTLLIEIGPGQGIVTDEILQLTDNIKLIERDDNLIDELEAKYGEYVDIIHQDVLEINIEKVTKNQPYVVIGSLPYNISKKIIQLFLTANNKPFSMAFILQREVSASYGALPPKATLLSNFARLYSEVKIGKVVPAKAFYPTPKVDGQIISFRDIEKKFTTSKEMWTLIRKGFSQPRKVLASNLKELDKNAVQNFLIEIGLNEKARAQELSIEDWEQLAIEFR